MAETPILGLPYPDDYNNEAPDVPAAIRALAEQVEDSLRLRAEVTTGVVTPASGWALSTATFRQAGTMALLQVTVRRSGAAINVPPSGNIDNQVIATVNPDYAPRFMAPMSSWGTGRAATGVVHSSDRHVILAAVGGTNNIGNNEIISLAGWILARG